MTGNRAAVPTDGAVPADQRRAERGPRPLLRALVALGLVLGTVAGAGSPAHAASGAAEIEEARAAAKEAADAFAASESRLAELEDAKVAASAAIAATRAEYDALRAMVAEEAVRQYVRAGAGATPLVSEDINVQARAAALSRVARGEARSQADALAAVKAQLERQEQDLARQEAAEQAERDGQAARRQELFAQLKELEAIEAQRVEAERQAEQARREAAARAELEAAATPQASSTVSTGSGGGSTGGSGGGSTGGSGGGSVTPAPARPLVPVSWLCPITGAYAFSDTWGDARSGGRTHRGTDMFADYGTPLVAVVGGEAVTYGWDNAGGYDIFLYGDDGNRYYYAHLQSYGKMGRVEQGDVIAYVGDSGNATGVPHLHFEIHPGGSGWTNPYSTLARYC